MAQNNENIAKQDQDITDKNKEKFNESSIQKNETDSIQDLPDIKTLSLQAPQSFMDFERDFKRYKGNQEVFYEYFKVIEIS